MTARAGTDTRVSLPSHGLTWPDVAGKLAVMRERDAKWREARTFGGVYPAGEEVERVAREAYMQFFGENAVHTDFFPSLKQMEQDVVAMAAGLFNGSEAVGHLTSGGTESLYLAVKVARDRAAAERGITNPHMVVPWTAYPVLNQIGHYLRVRVTRIPVTASQEADLGALEAAITPETVLVVGSAPNFPFGVVDPIQEMAAITRARNVDLHVDACVGGFQLPFLQKLGEAVPAFDFGVPGVTSLSADLHKFGYTALGTSMILYRSPGIHRYQAYEYTDWPMGRWYRPGMLGTRPGGAYAAAWAVMHYLGEDGYLALTRKAWETAKYLFAQINSIDGLQVWGRPNMSIFAYGSHTLDMAQVAQGMTGAGWAITRHRVPPSIHVNVTAPHAAVVERYVADLRAAVAAAAGRSS